MRDGIELTRTDRVHYKKDTNPLNAGRSRQQSSDATELQNDTFTRQLLSLICGHFCKSSSCTEVTPEPGERVLLSTSFAELTKNGFSKDICRGMIAMMDFDRSGKLGYEEFKQLWADLQSWKNVWSLYDTDKSGTFSGFELRDAMQSAGYRLNNKVLNALMHRYGTKHGEIQFDDFIMCAIKIKTVIDVFRAKDTTGTNAATFSMEDWLENILYM